MPPTDAGPVSPTSAGDRVLWLYHALNLAVALVWLDLFLELLSPARIPLADRGVPLGLMGLFFVLPAALLVLWRVDRRRRAPYAPLRRAYIVASRVFLGLSWLPTWPPILFLLALLQPWPLTLAEGPDTEFARAGFERLFGRAPPPSVHGIHYRVEGPRDPTFFLRCEGVDPALLAEAVERLRLQAAGVGPPVRAWDGRRPSWWPDDESSGFDRVFTAGDGWEALWYSERDGRLLYREVTF